MEYIYCGFAVLPVKLKGNFSMAFYPTSHWWRINATWRVLCRFPFDFVSKMRTQKIKPNASIQRALSPPLYGGSCASPTPSLSAVHVHDFVVVLCRLLRLAFVAGIKCESTRKRILLRERERDFCFSIAICHICGNCFVLLLAACSFPFAVSSFSVAIAAAVETYSEFPA